MNVEPKGKGDFDKNGRRENINLDCENWEITRESMDKPGRLK